MNDSKTIFVDVREPHEYAANHVPGAINLPLSQLAKDDTIINLPKDAKIVLYCRTGNRSAVAAQILHAQGYNAENGISQAAIENN